MEKGTSHFGNAQETKERGSINNMTALHHSITAQTRNGDLVEIVALGDVEGFSPACWVINGSGEIDLAPTDRLRVVDTSALPPQTFQQQSQLRQNVSSKY